jgi:hypothetical protein
MKRVLPIVVGAVAALAFAAATPAAPSTEDVYADGQTYAMIGATLRTTSSPGLLSAPPIYVIGYPTDQTSGPLILPSGYQPQCDPCNHGAFPYHDHVVTGEPGAGTNGTAGDYRAPWRIVAMAYSPAYYMSPDFVPITSDDQIQAYEDNGWLVKLNAHGTGDPFQVWTNMVLICPIVQQQG